MTSDESSAAPRRAAVTFDVDGVRHYHAIHGLPPPSPGDPIVERGVRRFLELCERLGIVSTLFVVGQDLDDDAFSSAVHLAARAGHEIGSHSHGHRYDLSRRAPAEIEADVARSVDAIARAAGKKPRGFRAPGYNLSEALLDALEKLGFAYDSSLMPSPLYFGARALAIGAHAATSRRGEGSSSSIVGSPREFLAPRAPYRPRRGARFKRARSRVEGRDLVEIPITTGAFRSPWLGTTLAMLPDAAGLAHTTATLEALPRGAPCVLELHAIDFVDADDGLSPALARVQRDVRVPVSKKLARIETTLRMLARTGDVVTLEALAAPIS